MKIFAIRDEEESVQKDLAYLIYYEQEKQFYIELPTDADEWETPLLLSSFVKRGKRTVNAYWSKLWVQQRIVPTDRQNLGQILKENGLAEYDEFSLLMLAEGRCAQDSYYLAPISKDELPEDFSQRYKEKVEDIIPLSGHSLLVFFRDGLVRKCSVETLLKGRAFSSSPILKDEKVFSSVSVQTGGYGVCWGESLTIDDHTLYQCGEEVPLTLEDFRRFISCRIVNTMEAAELLGCSKQNIEDLIRRDKLHPVKINARNKLFLKSEILQRKWQ